MGFKIKNSLPGGGGGDVGSGCTASTIVPSIIHPIVKANHILGIILTLATMTACHSVHGTSTQITSTMMV